MIWMLLDMLAHPEAYAVTIKDGEIHIRPQAHLDQQGIKVR